MSKTFTNLCASGEAASPSETTGRIVPADLKSKASTLRPVETKTTHAVQIGVAPSHPSETRCPKGSRAPELEAVSIGEMMAQKAKLRPTETRVTHDLMVEENMSDSKGTPTKPPELMNPTDRLKATHAETHGSLGLRSWGAPWCTAASDEDARPGFETRKANEYQDEPAVLSEKVALLASLIRKSRSCVVYSGAGISTSSGINDYATRASNSSAKADAPHLRSPFNASPTKSHRVLAALQKKGHLKYWIQQNHDGLPQKAGYPQHLLNEIHGAWYDPSNPVVPMSGQLRKDLFQDLREWEGKADLCLSLGTSMCGMNADRVAISAASKAKKGNALGLVIVGLQQTQYDGESQLRIFAKLDDVFDLLSQELDLELSEGMYIPDVGPAAYDSSVFEVPYNSDGEQVTGKKSILDLREESRVKLTSGPHAGAFGEVVSRCREGHYNIRFNLLIKEKFRAPHQMKLGNWWVEAMVKGLVPSMPVVSVPHDDPGL
ncbi:hypothetical protein CYMTET_25123 [Cymbomonas tetramitiformis]|uniref:Deacetylase sirtuin-type domain-containing protein n=1 Tax=Cymbomonas tetramitiformis TaxID=36881 RepID=A0AAE0KZ80_9CHLO|nr:hypothetical protein CYMTET_25123 [Cymbomonas tetramitiformis]